MSATPSRVQSAEKSQEMRRAAAKRESTRGSDKTESASWIETQDWRGEGVVGDLQTD